MTADVTNRKRRIKSELSSGGRVTPRQGEAMQSELREVYNRLIGLYFRTRQELQPAFDLMCVDNSDVYEMVRRRCQNVIASQFSPRRVNTREHWQVRAVGQLCDQLEILGREIRRGLEVVR